MSFTIDRPEYVCVIGPNGVGKSTLIEAMDGPIKPTSDRIEIEVRGLVSR